MCFVLIATVFVAINPASAAVSEHWAKKFTDAMVKDGVLPDQTNWDNTITGAEFSAGLSKVLGNDVKPPDVPTFSRGDMVKFAIDSKDDYKEQLKEYDFPPFCLANDEEGIPKDLAPYFNMAYRPKFQLINYRPWRTVDYKAVSTWAEAAQMLYMLKYPPNADPTQQVTAVTAQEPDTLNPFTTNALSYTFIATYIGGAGTVGQDDMNNLYPIECLRVAKVDNGDVVTFKDPVNGKDKMKVIWRIRPGIYWPPLSGEPEDSKLHEMTADDFMFSFRVGISPRVQATSRVGLYKIDYVKKVDKYTIELGYNEQYVYANFAPGTGRMYKDYFEQDFYTNPGDFNVRQDFFDKETGAYKLKTWDRGDHIEYEPNPYAIFSKPLIPKVIVKFMSDTNTIRLNLQGGNVDEVSNAFTPLEASDLEKKVPNYKFYYAEGTSWEHIDLDQFSDKDGQAFFFSDKRVRQALLMALDREQLCKIVSNGVFTPSHYWQTKRSPFYNEAVLKMYPYDPKKAEQLLDEAGWKLTKVGNDFIRCFNGDPTKPFKVKIATTSEQEFRVKNVEQMIKMWQRVGILVEPQLKPAKELFGGDFLRKHQFEMIEFAWVSNPLRPNANLWLSTQIPSDSNNWEGQCMGGWNGGPENDKICLEILKIVSDAKLKELMDAQAKIWSEELPALPLFNRYDVEVAARDIQNVRPTGSNITVNWNAEFWYREPIRK